MRVQLTSVGEAPGETGSAAFINRCYWIQHQRVLYRISVYNNVVVVVILDINGITGDVGMDKIVSIIGIERG